MRLTGAHIHKFKSINDANLRIEDSVTALVGKNESGKTAVLEAMYRALPIQAGFPTDFQELRDYPRRLKSREQKTIATINPIELTFEMNDDDVAVVDERVGAGTIKKPIVVVSRKYGSDPITLDFAWDETAMLRHEIEAAGLDAEKFLVGDRNAVVAALQADGATEAMTELAATMSARDSWKTVSGRVLRRVPRFQYFDEYSILPGVVSIERLQCTPAEDLEPGDRTALSLLRLAGVDSGEFTTENYEERKAALEAAGNQLTDELFQYWTQNDCLEVELDIEFRARPDCEPEPFLQVRVRNTRHKVTLNMNQRSKGFIWFFSFLAAFSEYADEDRRIILLDEPGLNLHAKAQADLLRFIDERLAPKHQVIYSTHSLFMIAPTKLERCRTVEDIDANTGTIVSEEIWKARPDTVFPLLGALGVDMAQTLIIGSEQLLVEGPSDVVYLTIMSDALRAVGRTPLDARWTLTPAGGIDKIPTFISLLGPTDLNIAVLVDGAVSGNQKIASFIERGLLDKNKLIALAEITGTAQADIEDMFDVGWYLKLLSASGVGKVTKSKLSQGNRIVRRVEGSLGAKFDHFQPANFLLKTPGTFTDEIDDATKDRFEQLFKRLNAILT